MTQVAIRGQFLTYTGDPFLLGDDATQFESDGLILMDEGVITACGTYEATKGGLAPGVEPKVYDSQHVILPGFLDTHVHYPQIQMTASGAKDLVEWLQCHTFPTEQQFSDRKHAQTVAKVFLAECLRAGTTTALVYCTVYPESVDAFFQESARLNTRMVAGKVLMDNHAPEALLDTPEVGYEQSSKLIERWHGRGRQLYAVTPRFAPSSTRKQLEMAGALWKANESCHMQTHLAETPREVAWVKELFPERKGYYDVYEHYGLTGPRAVFGHCCYLTEEELLGLHHSGSGVSHCPTSNLFLGSGLFDLELAVSRERPVRVGLGSDLGAGTSFCQMVTLGEAYKVASLKSGSSLNADQAYYLATQGAASSVYLEDQVGSIAPGSEADLVVLDLHATPYLRFRMKYAADVREALFLQMISGDDRAVHATYVAGECLYEKPREQLGRFMGPAEHLNHL